MGAAAHLQATNLGGLFDLALGDQAFELATAEHVGALADNDRAGALVDYECLDARNDRAPDVGNRARLSRGYHRTKFADMRRRCPTTSADQIDPARIDEAFELM